MRIYPELPRPRNRQVVADLAVLATLVLCAFLAWAVHAAVMTLTVITAGFTSISDGIHSNWTSAAEVLGGIPLVGNGIRGMLSGLADGTVGNVSDAGRSVTGAVTLVANVLGAVTMAVPTALILLLWLPGRVRRAKRWDAASRVLGLTRVGAAAQDAPDEAAQDPGSTLVMHRTPPKQLLAMRALCQIPLLELAGYEARPFEAYDAGRFDGLIAALYASEGLRPPP